jgi:hypothetical protein
MNRIMLFAAVIWLSLRDRWHMSKWNPWGAASPGGRHRATMDVVEQLKANGDAFLRTVTGPHGTPPSAPPPPVE